MDEEKTVDVISLDFCKASDTPQQSSERIVQL